MNVFTRLLRYGYYPFHLEDKITYHQKLLRVIEKTIFEDISHFYRLKTENLHHFKRILSYLATLPPGELNRNSIAKHIGIDNKIVQNYLKNAYLAKDDILFGSKYEIPLYLFGFLY